MKFGIFLLVVSVVLFITGHIYKGDPDMIDVNSACIFFGLLFMMCGGASILGGE